MKKYINYLAIGSSVLIVLYTIFKLIGRETDYRVGFISYMLFIIIFIISVIYAFKKKWIPIIVQTITLVIVFVVPPLIRTEVNFYVFKEDREEIIRMLVDEELTKDAEQGGSDGFAFYYTPPEYKGAVKSTKLRAAIHSNNQLYVFFQAAEPSLFDFVGLEEGFVYSSTGEFPTTKKFDSYHTYKKIDENWYFVSSAEDRFEKSCLFLCENKIGYQSSK